MPTGDPLRHVVSGERLNIPAAAYNAFTALVKGARQQTGAGHIDNPLPDETEIRIKAPAVDIEQFGVIAIREPVFEPADAPDTFAENYVATGAIPGHAEDFGRFAIAQGPIEASTLGRAVASGITFAKLLSTPDNEGWPQADIADGQTGYLRPCMRGAAQILWRESGAGVVWAVIRLSKTPPVPYVLEDCLGQQPTKYADVPGLEKSIGKVVKVQSDPDTCWQVRRAECDEIKALAAGVEVVAAEYEDCETCLACWKLTKCESDPEELLYTNTDLAAYDGKIVKLADGFCYEVEQAENCLNVAPVEVVDAYDDCTTCAYCYELEGCADPEDTLTVSNNLLALMDPPGEEPADVVGYSVRLTNGKCYEVTAATTDCDEAEAADIAALQASCSVCGCVKLTRVCTSPPEETPTVIYAHEATDEATGDEIDLRQFAGDGVIRLDDGHLYTVEETDECESTSAVVMQEHYGNNSPEQCPPCFRLEACDETDIKTFEDLYGLGYAIGDVLLLIDDEDNRYCYTVAEEIPWDNECVGLGSEEDPVDDKWLDDRKFESCDDCNLANRYKLTNTGCVHEDCEEEGAAETIVTTSDLHAVVGQFVKYKGVCYEVSETEDAITLPELEEDPPAFDTCDACKEAVTSWTETLVVDVRAKADEMKIQKRRKKISITGASSCDKGWEDIDTGEECEE